MSFEQEITAQLVACRDYMENSLGHIPEVRKLLRDIDKTLASQDSPSLTGAVYTPVGLLLLKVEIRGADAIVSTKVLPDSHWSAKLVDKLNAGVAVPLLKAPLHLPYDQPK